MRNFLSILFKSLLIVCMPATVFAETYYTENVTADSGWNDANKTFTTDNLLCWAATASNMLQWMQTNATFVPAGAPNGKAQDGSFEIFNTFKENWNDDGGNQLFGVAWFLYGNDSVNKEYLNLKSDASSSGGYWSKSDFNNKIFGFYQPFVGNTNNETLLVRDGLGDLYHSIPRITSDSYLEMLRMGINTSPLGLSLTNPSNSEMGHAVTAWGYETDEDGNLIGLYITDSDDRITGIFYHEISHTDGKLVLKTPQSSKNAGASNFTNWTLSGALGIFTPIPEPSLFGLFAGLSALVVAATRRRRK